MEQSSKQQQQVVGVVPAQIAYATAAYPTGTVVASGASPYVGAIPPGQPASSFPATPAMAAQHQLAYQQGQHFHNPQQHQLLQQFWAGQLQEAEEVTDLKTHSLPLARIKKIMKADEDVRMIAAEAPVVFAKACEMFILELTLRSWILTEENKRRTLQQNDITAAITRTDIFDFLVDIVPRDEVREDGLGMARAATGAPADPIPYYYVPTQAPGPGMIMGKPNDQATAAMYAAQPHHPMAYMAWHHPPPAQIQPAENEDNDHQQGSVNTTES